MAMACKARQRKMLSITLASCRYPVNVTFTQIALICSCYSGSHRIHVCMTETFQNAEMPRMAQKLRKILRVC